MYCTNCKNCYTDIGGYCCSLHDEDCEGVNYCVDKDVDNYNPYDDESDYDDDFNNYDD